MTDLIAAPTELESNASDGVVAGQSDIRPAEPSTDVEALAGTYTKAQQRKIRKQSKIETRRMDREARREAAREAREAARERRAERAADRAARRDSVRHALTPMITTGLLVALNTAAVFGQLSYFVSELGSRNDLPSFFAVPLAVLFAAVLEGLALFLGHQAALALRDGDSAAGKQIAAYLVAFAVATMNYSHFADPGMRPNVVAVAVGGFSAISPWAWGIHMRRNHRSELLERGEIERRTKLFGRARILWHPVRTIRVKSFATWETDKPQVVRDWEAAQRQRQLERERSRLAKRTRKQDKADTESEPTPFEAKARGEQVLDAFRATGTYAVREAEKWLKDQGVRVNRSTIYDAQKRIETRLAVLFKELGNGSDPTTVDAVVATLADEGWPTDRAFIAKFARTLNKPGETSKTRKPKSVRPVQSTAQEEDAA